MPDNDKDITTRLRDIAAAMESISGVVAPPALQRDNSITAQLRRIQNAVTASLFEAHGLGTHTDVALAVPAEGDLLKYDADTMQWVNRPGTSFISFAISNPDGITDHTERGTKSFCAFLNSSAYAYQISKITAISDVDDYTSTLYVSASTTDISVANDAVVTQLVCSDDGTSGYTDVVTTFTTDLIQPGQWLIWEHTSGDAGSFSVTIEGKFLV